MALLSNSVFFFIFVFQFDFKDLDPASLEQRVQDARIALESMAKSGKGRPVEPLNLQKRLNAESDDKILKSTRKRRKRSSSKTGSSSSHNSSVEKKGPNKKKQESKKTLVKTHQVEVPLTGSEAPVDLKKPDKKKNSVKKEADTERPSTSKPQVQSDSSDDEALALRIIKPTKKPSTTSNKKVHMRLIISSMPILLCFLKSVANFLILPFCRRLQRTLGQRDGEL